MSEVITFGISIPFGVLSPTQGQIARALLTLPPLDATRIATDDIPFDLHA